MIGRAGRIAVLLGVTAALFAALGPVRGVAEALRASGRLSETVLLLTLGAAAALIVLSRTDRREESEPPRASAGAWLAALAAGGLLFTVWELPEERVHLPQYAVVAALAWWALRPGLPAPLLAVLLIGLGDELAQGTLPQRTFDWRDVAANAVAGSSALLLLRGGRAAWAAPAVLLAGFVFFRATPPDLTPPPRDPLAPRSREPRPLAPGPSPAPAARDARFPGAPVLLLTVDALRADHLRPWGEPPVPLPAFERLADESVAVRRVFADSAWTSPGVVGLLTGLLPGVHGVEVRGLELNPAVHTLPDALRAIGYLTVGFAGDDAETYRNLGFEAVLDRELEGVELLDAALQRTDPDRPWFAWIHLRDIHAPYDASPARLAALGLPSELPDSPLLTRARTRATVPRAMFPGRHGWLRPAVRALYAAELADADAAVGAVLDRLAERGLLDRALVVVTADHGEELLEHHGIGHASTTLDSAPHPEIAQIPLFVRLPGGEGAGLVHEGRFRQADLAPTVAGLVGAPLPGRDRLDGLDWSGRLGLGPEPPEGAGPDRTLLLSTSPCGWQCPPERLDERVHAWVEGPDWRFCRTTLGAPEACDPALAEALRAQAARRVRLPPVPSPAP